MEPIQPIARDDADDVGEAPLAAATAFLHRDDARASLPALRLSERVLHRGPVHARPGRDGVDVQGATPVHPAFVADDAHHGDLAPCESGGQGRRQRAGCDEAAAPFNRGLLVGRTPPVLTGRLSFRAITSVFVFSRASVGAPSGRGNPLIYSAAPQEPKG